MSYIGFVVCEGGVLTVFRAIGYMFMVAKILIPIVLIVMGAVDLLKAIFGADPKAFSVSIKTLIQRIIAGIIIFFIPSLIYVVLDFTTGGNDLIENESSEGFYMCNECMHSPSKCTGAKNLFD